MIANDGAAMSSIMSRLGVGKPGPDEDGPEKETDSGLNTAADILIDAIFSKDTSATASALRAVFAVLEMEPHEEGPHERGTPGGPPELG